MKVIGLSGESGSGKTTLIEKLIPQMRSRGLRVSVVKHAHHGFEPDHEGKDTWRFREAGAFETVAASPRRLMLMREFERAMELSVHHVLAELWDGVDWAFVEGYRSSNLLKLEVWRAQAGKPARYMDDDLIVAIATNSPRELPFETLRPVLDLDDAAAVAQWLIDHGDRFDYAPEIYA